MPGAGAFLGLDIEIWAVDQLVRTPLSPRRETIFKNFLTCTKELVHYLPMKRSGKNGDQTEVQDFAFRLDAHSGVPVYRQLIDQVQAAIASGALRVGVQLPTVRQVAVDLTINPNTVMRAYREMGDPRAARYRAGDRHIRR